MHAQIYYFDKDNKFGGKSSNYVPTKTITGEKVQNKAHISYNGINMDLVKNRYKVTNENGQPLSPNLQN